jgi:hypothetical protein
MATMRSIASFSEDPANRRVRGGGAGHYTLYLIPMFRPEVLMTAGVPAVLHSGDFSLLSAAKPGQER